ncbi:MAG: tRNA pseudouridine(38-40) synthase TruA [Gammaproteobacteria bacterium]|nr:tRNA pseudouridine(38-40) synthase TruA [Gammaproteobacteria bacterium]MBU1653335.1 tRNA pseudouridine(38-40) synthase TruA [Gammaproteobacteria bacterium]MBU1962527.1 tRNA pseudouridine(38-40) synthase TruA [Gammaproteobacteria bacterium]
MRIALGIEYDGTRFHGWQTQQAGVRSVQEELEQALSKVAARAVRVQCAGRTDSGVHAVGQVVHFETEAQRDQRAWVLGGNSNLPFDINITWARPVPDSFNARYSAFGREYRYLISNRPTRSALLSRRAVWVHKPLDEGRMHEAAQHLIGTQDFSSYRALGCQAKSPVREMRAIRVHRNGDLVILDVAANAFLHHMVRNIAGVLIAIGKGERPTDWSREVLELRDRTLGGVTAPPQGLYLTRVHYPPEYAVPAPGTVYLELR